MPRSRRTRRRSRSTSSPPCSTGPTASSACTSSTRCPPRRSSRSCAATPATASSSPRLASGCTRSARPRSSSRTPRASRPRGSASRSGSRRSACSRTGVASAEDIDAAMTLGYKHPVGPLRLTDLVGLDVRLGIAEYLLEHARRAVRAARPAAPHGRRGQARPQDRRGLLPVGRPVTASRTTTMTTKKEPTMTEILPSYVNGAWWTPDGAAAARIRDRGARRVDRRGRRPGLDRGPRPRRRARVRPHRRAGLARRADLPPARRAAQADGPRPHRAQGRALRALEPHGRDEAGLLGRHRRRHRRALHLLGQGPPRDAELAGVRRRRGREPLEGRLIPRAAYLHPPARRGRADQRVQLPRVGLAREVRARVPRRRAHAREARDAHRLPRRGLRAHPRRVRPAARRLAAAGLGQRARPLRPPAARRPRRVHGLGVDRGAPARARLRADRRRAVHERDRLDQRERARHRCGRGHARVRRVREAARRGDDDEGRARSAPRSAGRSCPRHPSTPWSTRCAPASPSASCSATRAPRASPWGRSPRSSSATRCCARSRSSRRPAASS